MDHRIKLMATKTAKVAVPADEKLENQDFDLFEALAAIDKKDYHWFDNLSEAQQKKFVPIDDGEKPRCVYFVKEISRNCEIVDFSQCF
jgi:hypothetical protein